MKKVSLIMCNNMHMDIEKANQLLNKISASSNYKVECDYTKADIIIIMTCAFGNGKLKTMQIISDVEVNMKESAELILTGCMVKTNIELLKKIPNAEVIDLAELMKRFSNIKSNYIFIPQNKIIISSGCQKKCSYCVYQNIECKYNSKPKEQIFNELQKIYERETTIYITGGLETSDYGIDLYGKQYNISSLVKEICTKYPDCNYVIGWFHPHGLTDEFLSVLMECKNIVEIMVHIQHVSEHILKDMNRPSFEYTDKKIRNLRKLRPDLAISTEVIVGFPGETKEDFMQLVNYLDKGYFDDIGVASYEQVENTKAGKLLQIPLNVRMERMEFLMHRYKKTFSYPSPIYKESELEDLYNVSKNAMKSYKGLILNKEARQQYKYIAGTDTMLKLNLKDTVFQIYETILNARDELEVKRVKNKVQELYTEEFRNYILLLIKNSLEVKKGILNRAECILLDKKVDF